MSEHNIGSCVIIDEDGKLVNIMTQGDFVSYTWPELHLGKNRQFIYIVAGLMIYTLVILLSLRLS